MVQIWPGQTVTCLHTNCPGHIWTTLYKIQNNERSWVGSSWQLKALALRAFVRFTFWNKNKNDVSETASFCGVRWKICWRTLTWVWRWINVCLLVTNSLKDRHNSALTEVLGKTSISKQALQAFSSFGFLSAMLLKIRVFWDVTPCLLVNNYRRFGGA